MEKRMEKNEGGEKGSGNEREEEERTAVAENTVEAEPSLQEGESNMDCTSPERDEDALLASASESNDELDKGLGALNIKGQDRPPRLGGAARKRFKYLVAHGIPPSEARVQALKPLEKVSTSGKGSKRVRSEGNTPEGHKEKKQKRLKEGRKTVPTKPPRPTFSQMAGGIRIGILPTNFPEELLTTAQTTDVQEAILDKVVETGKKATTKPKFLSSHNRPGWLAVVCADNATLQWLKDTINSIKPWESASLRIAEEADIPHSEIFTTYVPGSLGYSTERILSLIEAQNESLNATNWRVLRRSDQGPMVELTLSVDCQSAERLNRIGYAVCYRFGHIVLRPKSTSRAQGVGEGSREQPGTSVGGTNHPREQQAAPATTGNTVPEGRGTAVTGRTGAGQGGHAGAPTGNSVPEGRRRVGAARPDKKGKRPKPPKDPS